MWAQVSTELELYPAEELELVPVAAEESPVDAELSTELELSVLAELSASAELSMSWLPLPLWLLPPSASEAEEISSDVGSVALLLSSQAVSEMASAAAASPQPNFTNCCFILLLLFSTAYSPIPY
jgi:hypothetical protein